MLPIAVNVVKQEAYFFVSGLPTSLSKKLINHLKDLGREKGLSREVLSETEDSN